MSQPPTSPYPGPQQPYGYDPYAGYQQLGDVLAPARRASIMMFIAGAILLLCGIACSGIGLIVPWDELLAEQPQLQSELSGISTDLIKGSFIGMSVAGFLFGVGMIVVGFFVRRGTTGPLVVAVVGVSVVILALGLICLGGLIQAIASRQAQTAVGSCVYALPLIYFVILLLQLIQALRATPGVRAAQEQQAAYWQYAQQQQAYQQSMYGYQQQSQQQQPPASPSDQPPQQS